MGKCCESDSSGGIRNEVEVGSGSGNDESRSKDGHPVHDCTHAMREGTISLRNTTVLIEIQSSEVGDQLTIYRPLNSPRLVAGGWKSTASVHLVLSNDVKESEL